MAYLPIFLASTGIAKKPLFGIAIAKLSVNRPLPHIRNAFHESSLVCTIACSASIALERFSKLVHP